MSIGWDLWDDAMLIDRAYDPGSEVNTERWLVYIYANLHEGVFYLICFCLALVLWMSVLSIDQLTDAQHLDNEAVIL